MFVTTPALVGVIDAVLAGSLVATVALLAGLAPDWSILIALATFVVCLVAFSVYQLRSFADRRHLHAVAFPTPSSAQEAGQQ